MPVRKVVNANEVFPDYIVRQLQQRLKGKGTLIYIPAVPESTEAPYNLRMAAYFTAQGWSASRIATRLKISARQVQRLRREAREHPERLAPKPPPTPAVYPPTEPATPRKPSRAQIERRQREAEQARHERIFGQEPLTPPTDVNRHANLTHHRRRILTHPRRVIAWWVQAVAPSSLPPVGFRQPVSFPRSPFPVFSPCGERGRVSAGSALLTVMAVRGACPSAKRAETARTAPAVGSGTTRSARPTA